MALARMALNRLFSAAVLRRPLAVARYSTPASSHAAPASSGHAVNESSIPTDQEQATGLEKKEIDALAAGIENPFNMKVQTGPWGTKEKPQVVPSMFEERIVGCICDEDSTSITWMVLKKGPPGRCECGHWYQLAHGNPIKVH